MVQNSLTRLEHLNPPKPPWVFSPFANAQRNLHLLSSIRDATLKPEVVKNHGDMTCTTFRTHEME